MGIEAYETTVEWEIGSIEAEAPRASGGEPHRLAYPYPALTPTDEIRTVEFRVLTLESATLKASVVPALGGRLAALLDKRTGLEIFPAGPLRPTRGGRRGAHLRHGLQIRVDSEDRPNSLGPVECEIQESESGPRIACAEIVAPAGIGCHWFFGLSDDRAELVVGCRAFNRNLAPRGYDGGICFDLGQEAFELDRGAGVYDRRRDVGLAIWEGDAVFDGRAFADGSMTWSRFGTTGDIAGRATDSWVVRIVPWSGLGGIAAVSAGAALCVDEKSVRLQVAGPLTGGRLEMVSREGEKLAASIDSNPGNPIEIGLKSLPKAMALVDASRQVLLGWEPDSLTPLTRRSVVPIPEQKLTTTPEDDPKELRRATTSMSTRYRAHAALAIQAMRRGDWDSAEDELTAELTYNGEDPLAWWCKAIVARLRGDEDPDPSPMLNVHFVAPNEPAVRAEAYLSSAQAAGKEPNALLAPMKNRPDEFVEIACMLIDFGLLADASRWIDEALRHADLPILRYLAAYAFALGPGMLAEAASQVSAAAQVGVVAPFPWREVESRALAALSERFPQDETLRAFRDLAGLAAK